MNEFLFEFSKKLWKNDKNRNLPELGVPIIFAFFHLI